MESIGGYMWLIIDVVLVAALAAAILWGTHQWRQRGGTASQGRARPRPSSGCTGRRIGAVDPPREGFHKAPDFAQFPC